MKKIQFLPVMFAAALAGGVAQARPNVVATLPDLGAIAAEIGGDHIQLSILARGTEDAHFVDPKPSFISILNKADLLIEGGAELEEGWLPPLVNNARNSKILPRGRGRLDASRGIRLLDVPTGPIDRSQGDVHASGNPHYMLDPMNGRIVAEAIARRLGELDPENAAAYGANLKRFQTRLEEKIADWSKQWEPYRGARIVTYHKSFDYFANRFGLIITGQIEPKPGVEPSATHVRALVPRLKEEEVKLIVIETNRPRKTPEFIATQVGAKLVVVPGLPGGSPGTENYFDWIDSLVGQMIGALKDTP